MIKYRILEKINATGRSTFYPQKKWGILGWCDIRDIGYEDTIEEALRVIKSTHTSKIVIHEVKDVI